MNKSLVTLDISSNRLSKSSCPHLRDMLRMSTKLENLNVACNQLGPEGGKILLEGVKMSRPIKRVSSILTNYEMLDHHFYSMYMYMNCKYIVVHYSRLMFGSQDVEERLIYLFKKYCAKINQ